MGFLRWPLIFSMVYGLLWVRARIGTKTPTTPEIAVIFTVREAGEVYRIISARKASRKERKLYEEFKRISL